MEKQEKGELINEFMADVFVEQPLDSPGSAKYPSSVDVITRSIPHLATNKKL